jgi:hypothetical protein
MIDQSVLEQHAQPIKDKARFLDSSHLRSDLQPFVEQFERLGQDILNQVPSSPELTLFMQKLVETKDQAVRAKLHAIEHGLYAHPL